VVTFLDPLSRLPFWGGVAERHASCFSNLLKVIAIYGVCPSEPSACPERNMLSQTRSSVSITWLLVGLFVLGLLACPFLPLLPCPYCGRERQEIQDWMREPYLGKYREEHPEAIARAKADLRRFDEQCTTCFHGRISLKQDLWGSQR
jgi:hypothetical protein